MGIRVWIAGPVRCSGLWFRSLISRMVCENTKEFGAGFASDGENLDVTG
jgi:hypothetical protein